MALVVASDQRIVGATLGNDVNLRDFEGRSAHAAGQGQGQRRLLRLGPFCACSMPASPSITCAAPW